MRSVKAADITELVESLALEAAFSLGDSELAALKNALDNEASPQGRKVLETLIENNSVASSNHLPLCQDCGSAIVWIERGDNVVIEGGSLTDAVNSEIRQAYAKGFLRKSILRGGLDRVNTGDNTPAFIRCECVPGDTFRIIVAAKGGGAENTSALAMLTPAEGRNGIINFVIETVKKAGGKTLPACYHRNRNGGNFEGVALAAKKALFRPLGNPNPDPRLAGLEQELLTKINNLGIGPMGLGGNTTALAVHVIEEPCHIASLPVAVNIECHSHKHREGEL